MHNLAVTYRDHGRYQEAESLFARALDLRRRVLGEEHADTMSTMIDRAYCCGINEDTPTPLLC